MSKTSKSVWLYYKIMFIAIVLIAWIGFALPYLISAKDDAYVIGGIFITVLTLPLLVMSVIDIFQQAASLNESDGDDDSK